MKANTAATKIQANFRGYRVRKQLKENLTPTASTENGIYDISEGQKKIKRQDTKNSLEEKSATKIQAGIRGYLVRKRNQVAQAAATRIQAGFRGFKTRKQLKQTGQ
uniref:Myosin motor domain-containing protein n=1 Tax=Bracon brevicornis TaxID=1563983 RepID=A0A6V7MBH3_9HYME